MSTLPKPSVSVVIPCRNEESCIASCLDSILANDYPSDLLEVLVVDGMSSDGTRQILAGYTRDHGFIRVVDNPGKEQQLALNVGITAAGGEIIIRMDAHSTYARDYITRCVEALQKYGADNVGGRWITVPRDDTLLGRAICYAMSVPFGVGNAYYRLMSLDSHESLLKEPRWEINAAYFCCRKAVFGRIGLFNEHLDRSEDIDFRARLRQAGLRSLFVPDIVCYYAMRTRPLEFIRHMFRNGLWVLLPLAYAPRISLSFRHIVPLIFLVGMGSLAVLSVRFPLVLWLLAALAGLYCAGNLYYSLRIALRERDARYFLVLPAIFAALHVSYGAGSVVGVFFLLFEKAKRVVSGNGGGR